MAFASRDTRNDATFFSGAIFVILRESLATRLFFPAAQPLAGGDRLMRQRIRENPGGSPSAFIAT
jgi:hypothetical protein